MLAINANEVNELAHALANHSNLVFPNIIKNLPHISENLPTSIESLTNNLKCAQLHYICPNTLLFAP